MRVLLGMHIIDQMTKKLDFPLLGNKGIAGQKCGLHAVRLAQPLRKQMVKSTEISCDRPVHNAQKEHYSFVKCFG